MEKTPGGNTSLARFFGPVDTVYEQLLFWQLFIRCTVSGSTQWHKMSTIWSYEAQKRHQLGDFTVSLKNVHELKVYHKQLIKMLAVQLSVQQQPATGTVAAAEAAARRAKVAAMQLSQLTSHPSCCHRCLLWVEMHQGRQMVVASCCFRSRWVLE